jgi:anti-sigma B factor antagonist
MRINENLRGDIVILAPAGRLTIETESELSGAVRRALAAGRRQIVLDLGGVPYIDSCGLGVIAQSYVAAFRRGGTVKLARVNRRNLRLLTITKLLTVFEHYDGVEDAARSFGPELYGPSAAPHADTAATLPGHPAA